LSDTIRTAAANISGSRLRSALTITIVTLGITCLVGAQTAIDCLSGLLSGAFGASAEHISITASHPRGGPSSGKEIPIGYMQAAQFAAEFDCGTSAVYTYVPPVAGVSCGGERLGPQTTVLAFEGDYLGCNGLVIGQGRDISRYARLGGDDCDMIGDGRHARLDRACCASECLVGKKVAAKISDGGGTAVGSLLNVGGKAFRIAGVIREQSSLMGIINDNTVFIPLGSVMGSLVDERCGYSIDLLVSSGEEAGAAARAESLMRRIRHIAPGAGNDFEIVEGSAAVREIARLSGSLEGIALIIGILTLLGAAVALTNIMLICVAERTREVGLRRAVGASRRDIRAGFVCEALLICEAGCIIGTLLGVLCGNILGQIMHTGVQVPWDWIAIAQAICLAVGIAACALPARRASALNVVDALRCE